MITPPQSKHYLETLVNQGLGEASRWTVTLHLPRGFKRLGAGGKADTSRLLGTDTSQGTSQNSSEEPMAFKGSIRFLDGNSASNYRVPARCGAPRGTDSHCCRPKQAAYPATEASLMRAIPEVTVRPGLPEQLCITTAIPAKLFIGCHFTFKSVSV